MLKLYGVGRSRATRNLWLLGEIGKPFELVPVIQAYRLKDPLAPDAPLNTRSPAFLALSPAGAIPVLDDDGFVLTKSLAINLYIARAYGGALGPRDACEEALMLQWSLYAATWIERDAMAVYYAHNEKRIASAEGQAEIATLSGRLARPLGVIEGHLARHGHMVGGRFTAADIAIAEHLRYAQFHPPILAAYPATTAWLAACQSRPAFKAVMEQRAAEPV